MGPGLVREMGRGQRGRDTGMIEVTVWVNQVTNEDNFAQVLFKIPVLIVVFYIYQTYSPAQSHCWSV